MCHSTPACMSSYIFYALYAPIGGVVADLLGQPPLYGMVAGVGLAYFLKGKLPLQGQTLWIVAGASFGYLYLGDMVGGDMMGAVAGAALGFGVRYLMSGGSSSSSKSYNNMEYVSASGVSASGQQVTIPVPVML